MPYCPHCGNEVPAEALFCPKCGAKNQTQIQASTKRTDNPFIILVSAIAVVALLGGIGVYVYKQLASNDGTHEVSTAEQQDEAQLIKESQSADTTPDESNWETLSAGRVSLQYPKEWGVPTQSEGSKQLAIGYIHTNAVILESNSIPIVQVCVSEHPNGTDTAGTLNRSSLLPTRLSHPDYADTAATLDWDSVVRLFESELKSAMDSANSYTQLGQKKIDNNPCISVHIDQLLENDPYPNAVYMRSETIFFNRNNALGECVNVIWLDWGNDFESSVEAGIQELEASGSDPKEIENLKAYVEEYKNSGVSQEVIDEIIASIRVA